MILVGLGGWMFGINAIFDLLLQLCCLFCVLMVGILFCLVGFGVILSLDLLVWGCFVGGFC